MSEIGLIKDMATFLKDIRNHPYTEDEILDIIRDEDKYWEWKAKQFILMLEELGILHGDYS